MASGPSESLAANTEPAMVSDFHTVLSSTRLQVTLLDHGLVDHGVQREAGVAVSRS